MRFSVYCSQGDCSSHVTGPGFSFLNTPRSRCYAKDWLSSRHGLIKRHVQHGLQQSQLHDDISQPQAWSLRAYTRNTFVYDQRQSASRFDPMYAVPGPHQTGSLNYGSNTPSQWQAPTQPHSSSGPGQSGGTSYGAPNKGSGVQNISGEAEGVSYEISYRDVNSIVTCQLQSNASINIKAGVMAGMSANLRLDGKVKLTKMLLPGTAFSSCVSAPNGPGELILAPPMMADVMPLHLNPGTEWIVGENCFLGYTPGVQKSTKMQGFGKALFSGEGLFVTKLSGTGVAFITSLGAIHGIHLEPGQEYIIDNDHLVAWSATMTYKTVNVGSLMTSIVSSEGKVCRFAGPGTVYMQTRNPSALANYMRSIGGGKSE